MIRWKFRFTPPLILIQWPLQNFVHGMTAVLLWHVQTFVAIWRTGAELQQGEVSIEFELRSKIVSETGRGTCDGHYVLPGNRYSVESKKSWMPMNPSIWLGQNPKPTKLPQLCFVYFSRHANMFSRCCRQAGMNGHWRAVAHGFIV